MGATRSNGMTVMAVCTLALAAPALGQVVSQPAPDARPASERRVVRERAGEARYQIRVMEGVLERAVQHGAHVVSAEIREVAPDLVFFSGPARARGFQLEGYGVFFSVDVPAVRRSLVWSFRTLNPDGRQVEQAMASLRRAVEQFQADPRTKRELQQALRLVELQVGPLPAGADVEQGQPGAAGRPVEVEQAAATSAAKRAVIAPDEAYEAEVKQALVDAMLDYGPPLGIASDQWLTVAARGDQDRTLPGELGDEVTIVLRVRGGDLQAFRAGRLGRDEARQRVEVREH